MDKVLAFGDESNRRDIASYAFAITKTKNYAECYEIISRVKGKYSIEGAIHCRTMFDKNNSIFRMIGSDGIYELFSDVLVSLYNCGVRYSIGACIKPDNGDEQILVFQGEDDSSTEEFTLNQKNYNTYAFFAAAMPMIDRLQEYDVELRISEDRTKVPHFGMRRQIHNTMKFWDSSRSQWMHPTVCSATSDPFFEISDIVSYLSSVAMYPLDYDHSVDFKKKSQEILKQVKPLVSEYVFPSDVRVLAGGDWSV